MQDECSFCQIPEDKILFSNQIGIVIQDSKPITQGHGLVLPRRHLETLSEALPDEKSLIFELVEEYKLQLERKGCLPNGYDIRKKRNFEAGQIVPHFHIHMIPLMAVSNGSSDPFEVPLSMKDKNFGSERSTNTGRKWTSEADELLVDLVEDGMNLQKLMSIFGRQSRSIIARQKKLGIDS